MKSVTNRYENIGGGVVRTYQLRKVKYIRYLQLSYRNLKFLGKTISIFLQNAVKYSIIIVTAYSCTTFIFKVELLLTKISM